MDSKPPNPNFSLPPPGFSKPIQSNDAQQPPPPQGSGNVKYVSIKEEFNSPPPRKADSYNPSRFSYYQGSNIQPNYSRLAGQNNMGMPFMHGSPGMAMGSRNFSMPPPPSPVGDSIPPPQMGYAMQNNPYSYGMPSTPPPPIIGAGQYATSKHGNYQQHHKHGDYNRGYDKRNAHYANVNRKRNSSNENDYDGPRKLTKKKKKPLSQNLPARKEWTTEDAERALAVEREYNKLHKNPSLIIKFPDLELNRDIVSSFSPLIESVHFQQPSTPRFCFVTLSDSSRIKEVIETLNKTKFGLGYLCAEPKNTKDEESVKGPEDIDPLTLYVGNLAQEVTVDDVVKAFPKHKRIDIGFAKKMKYTRYAFVGFRSVDDAIEAFQTTHSTEMYSKSLIVRFRRLHGTVGLPGDAKSVQVNRKETKATEGEQQTESAPSDVLNTTASCTSLLKEAYDKSAPTGPPMFDPIKSANKVVIKSEFPDENDHVPLSDPKAEPQEDFLEMPVIKQEISEEPESEYDFMKTFVDKIEENL